MPEVKGLGEPCDGERHARFDEGRLETALPRQPSTLLMRSILSAAPKSLQSMSRYGRFRMHQMYGLHWFCGIRSNCTNKMPKAIHVLEDEFDDMTRSVTSGSLPQRLRTTNGVERLNEEIRRREKFIRIFLNRESLIRLLGELLMRIDEK